jgi:microcystin degradation protein MlrC
LASALHERRLEKTFVALFDREAVEKCTHVGSTIDLAVGGKSDALHVPPLHVRAMVVSIHDGKFVETEARHGGMTRHDMGLTAIVRTQHGMMIQLTSRRVPPFSLGQITSCGIDPKSLRIIVAKGVHAPVAAYSPVCPTMIRVNTPGVTTADMSRLQFMHRRRPMFPFEDEGMDRWRIRC